MIEKVTCPFDRRTWILLNVEPPILDVGCADGWIFKGTIYEDKTIFLDINLIKMKNFIHADGHYLPFRDNSFKTVCLCEIIEHVRDPQLLLKEAYRVTYKKVVFTIPSEYDWTPELKPCTTIEERLKETGMTMEELFKKEYSQVEEPLALKTGEWYHNRWFKDEDIIKLLKPYRYKIYKTFHPHGWVFYSGIIFK